MDLFSTAGRNVADLDRQLGELTATTVAGRAGVLARFAEKVASDGRISINVRVQTLINFLDSGTYQNIYEWAAAQAKRSSKDSETILRERLGTWYERRVQYDRSFVDGERFRYGALNMGGDGASKYGSFCLVVGDTVPARWEQVAYLPGDALLTFFDGSGMLNTETIAATVGPHSHRHHVAAIKHATALESVAEADWVSMLCSDSSLVEATFIGTLQASDLQSVRISKKEHEILFDYAFEDFSAKLSAPDRLWIDTFRMALERLEKHHIELEVVP